MGLHACDPSNVEAEKKGSRIQGQLWLYSKFKSSLLYKQEKGN